VEKYT